MAIDSHFHIWQLARGDYGWLNSAANPAVAAICRDVTVAHWHAQLALLGGGGINSECHANGTQDPGNSGREGRWHGGVEGGVLVQAAPTEAETAFLLQQAEQYPSVLGVVGWVDWLAPNAPARIQALAQHPQIKGLRPMLQDIADPAWILRPDVQPALHAMADCGLVLDALVKSAHLPHLLTLAQRHPALKIVIDHGGKPNIAAQEWQPWADGMAQLAQKTHAWCKVSGLLTEAGPQPATSVARPWMQHLATTFGPNRLLWGSDWPVLELSGTRYADWWRECHDWVGHWRSAEQCAFWGDNAREVYSISSGSG